MNHVWIILLLTGILVGAFNGRLEEVGKASFQGARQAVDLALGLIGAMTLWLGLMKVAEKAGLMAVLARLITPVMGGLFKDVPPGHPAMGAMVMNLAANMMGLGNAATPLGIRAMQELERLNTRKGEATDAMCLFLAINTSSVTLLPLGVMAVRAAAGAADPGRIILPTLLATCCSTGVAVASAALLRRIWRRAHQEVRLPNTGNVPEPQGASFVETPLPASPTGWRRWALPGYTLAFVSALVWGMVNSKGYQGSFQDLQHGLIPFLMGFLALYGMTRRVPVYEALCEGGKEGFQVALRIIPYLVAVLVVVAIFRESGALGLLTLPLEPMLGLVGMPPDLVPLALVRPLSGSGAFAIMTEIVSRSPNSLEAFMASIMQGSTDTTFYILAVYFGAVGISRIKYALWACLAGDAAGIMASVIAGNLFYQAGS